MTYEPIDFNGDGVADAWGADYNGDGLYEGRVVDVNGDGIIDVYGYDYNQNGYFEYAAGDYNQDGIPEVDLVDNNENGVDDRGEYSATHTAPGTGGPMMTPVEWQTGTSGMVFGPGAEAVMGANSHAINNIVMPDGYEFVPEDD